MMQSQSRPSSADDIASKHSTSTAPLHMDDAIAAPEFQPLEKKVPEIPLNFGRRLISIDRIPTQSKERDFLALFQDYGERLMTRFFSNKQRHIVQVMVKFATAENADAFMKFAFSHKLYPDELPLNVRYCHQLAADEIENNSLFVRNVPNDITEGDIRRLFAQYGDLKEVQVMTLPRNGRAYATLTYATIDQAAEAAKSTDSKILFPKDGRHVTVKYWETPSSRQLRLQRLQEDLSEKKRVQANRAARGPSENIAEEIANSTLQENEGANAVSTGPYQGKGFPTMPVQPQYMMPGMPYMMAPPSAPFYPPPMFGQQQQGSYIVYNGPPVGFDNNPHPVQPHVVVVIPGADGTPYLQC